jgi:hypothetical protein
LSFVARPVWRDAMVGTETKVSDETNRKRGGAEKKSQTRRKRETPLERLLFRFGPVVAAAFCRLGPIGNTKFGHTQPVRLIRL